MRTITAQENHTNNSYYIKYYPGIKESLGCEKAALILGRLEYWFGGYSNGFYKFIEPCRHPLYKKGDSWFEEIGFSRKLFVKAFDLIGVRYKSKSAFVKAKDRFQGKLYASYHDRKTNQTHFVRNHQFASEFIQGLFSRTSSLPVSAPASPTMEELQEKKGGKKEIRKEIKKEARKEENSNETAVSHDPKPCVKKGRSKNGPNGRSYGGTIGGKEIPIQRSTPSLGDVPPKPTPIPVDPEHTKMTEEMIKIWKEEVGDLGITSFSARFLERLLVALKDFFDQSLEAWKAYCCMISSSKFLMGEAQNRFFKKAWITWAIKGETIERIKGGGV